MKKRMLTLALALLMMLSLFPISAFTEGEEITEAEETLIEEELADVVLDDALTEVTEESDSAEDETPIPVDAAGEPFAATLTVCAAPDAGLNGDVTVSFTAFDGGYAGTLYLPGSADASRLCFSWDESVTVTGFESGSAPVPAVGQSLCYELTVGEDTAECTVTTMQGSVGVEGMFFDIDEDLGSIAAMYADTAHNTSCFGQLRMDGKTMDMSIKGRGNSTWTYNFEKKPFNITIYKDEAPQEGIAKYDKKDSVKLIDGVKSKKWSLLASAKDSSLLRCKLGYDLACKLGVGLQSRFVDVWMNGKYIGNYLLTPKPDYDAPKNGYQVEIDNKVDTEDPQFTLTNFNGSARKTYFTVKDNGADAPVADIQAYLQKAADAIFDSDSTEYLKYIDPDSWAKFYLLNEFYKDIDVVSGSKYMYRNGLADSDKLFAGPVWDLDGIFGRTYPNSAAGMPDADQLSTDGWFIDSIPSDARWNSTKAWLQELGKHKDFTERVYELYNEYKAVLESTSAEIDRLASSVAASALMNFRRYALNQTVEKYFNVVTPKTVGSGKYQVTYPVTNSWQDYVNNLKLFVNARLAFLADQLSPRPAVGWIVGNLQADIGETVSLTAELTDAGETGYQWQSNADGVNWANIPGAIGKTYSVAMAEALNGISFRCVVRNAPVIQTVRVAKAPIPATETVLEPVTLQLHEHSYTELVIAPTCTKSGYTVHSCKNCDKSYTDNETAPLGHSYKNGKCIRCGVRQSISIPTAIENYVRSVTKTFTTLISNLFRLLPIFRR